MPRTVLFRPFYVVTPGSSAGSWVIARVLSGMLPPMASHCLKSQPPVERIKALICNELDITISMSGPGSAGEEILWGDGANGASVIARWMTCNPERVLIAFSGWIARPTCSSTALRMFLICSVN